MVGHNPHSWGDPEFCARSSNNFGLEQAIIRKIRDRGITVILIEHHNGRGGSRPRGEVEADPERIFVLLPRLKEAAPSLPARCPGATH